MADKYLELIDGEITEREVITYSHGWQDAGSLVGLGDDGRLDMTMMPKDVATTLNPADHGYLLGLADDDHTQYRLESEDHSHQSTGAQAGQLSHSLALTGLAYADAGHTGFEPTVTKGNLTASVPLYFDNTRQVIGGATGVSLKNNAVAPAVITAIDIGVLANSDTVVPTSQGVVTAIGAHAALTTGVHGVGASTLASVANIATHAALITGIHGLVFTAGKTLTLTESLTFNAAGIGALRVATAANVIGNLAVGLTTQILVGGGAGTVPAWGTDIPTAVTIGTKYIYRADGTDVPVADGGTGVSTFALNGVLYGNAANAIGVTAIGAAGQILRVGASPFVPAWTTATYPATTTAYQLLVSTAANTIGELAAVGATGQYLAGVTGAIPAWATLNQAAVAGLTTADGPTFAHLHISDLAAIYTPAESWVGPSSTTGIYFKDGLVGIGTTGPGALLEVKGVGIGKVYVGQWLGNSGYGAIGLAGDISAGGYNILSSGGDTNLYFNRPTDKDIRFRESNVDQVTIQGTSGNVGIGTASPDGQLSTGLANGQQISYKSLTELTTIAAAATTVTTMAIPANVIVKAVSVRVTVVIPTAATFTVIGNTSTTAFNTVAVAVVAGSVNKGNLNCPYNNGASQTIRITPNATPADNSGRVRVTIWYEDSIPPTS